MDRLVIEKALDSDFKDFEDALQNFSTVNYGKIDVINYHEKCKGL